MKPLAIASLAALIIMTASAQSPDNLPKPGDRPAAHRVGATGVLITTGLTEAGSVNRASGDAVPDHVVQSLEDLFSLPEFAGA